MSIPSQIMRNGHPKVWFSLPVDFSPELNFSGDSHTEGEFHRLVEDTGEDSALSQYSYNTPQQPSENQLSQYSYSSPQQSQCQENQDSQYSYTTPPKAQVSANDLSQYSIKTMDTNSTNETYSTNDSPDVSTSQQSSEANLSQSGLEEGTSVASSVQESQHEEVVNSAIMEVSGELMLGKLSQQKYPSGGSESSDISDDDSRRMAAGGSIVKYPESSTGMSDNDWNPYATESDTNQTPRSAVSDDKGVNSQEPVTTVSMMTGEVTTSRGANLQPQLQQTSGNVLDDYRVLPTAESESYKPRYREDTSEPVSQGDSDSRSGRLDILRYMIDDGIARNTGDRETMLYLPSDEQIEQVTTQRVSPTDKEDEGRKSLESTKSDTSEPSQKSQGGFSRDSEETLKGRDSAESARSLQLPSELDLEPGRLSVESVRSGEHRESLETVRSHHTEGTENLSGRQSTESGRSDEFRRESAESYKSLPAEDYGGRSGRQSSEASRSPRSGYQSVESWKSPRSELDKSGETRSSGRESAESQHSLRSDRSRGSELSLRSQRSHTSTGSAAGPDRLDRLNQVGDNIKELIEFESAQRQQVDKEQEKIRPESPRAGELSRRVKLSDKFEAYTAPARNLNNPARSDRGYVSVAERERLISESPDNTASLGQTQSRDTLSYKPDLDFKDACERDSRQISATAGDIYGRVRSPSEVSMKRVSDLFEETKKQSRAAVSLPRPDPSGSEERFPLRERLSLSQHADDSFKSHDRTGHSGISEKSRDSETARSITSEEVARVLGKYVDTEKENQKPDIKVSAFDKIDSNTNALNVPVTGTSFDDNHHEMSDDELAKRVRSILSDREYLGIVGGNGRTLPRSDPTEKYIPHTIDYSKLQLDLQEIQDSLHDVPPPKANDSLYQFRQLKEAEGGHNLSGVSDSGHFKSAESTSTSGRESGISNFSRKLAWDHAADLQYDEDYTGQFYGTMTSTDTDTLTGLQKLRKSGTLESDNLIVRAESTTTTESEAEVNELQTEDTVTAAAQSIVDQVLSRHAEGPLQENVEDIIARYRNERQDLFDRFQPYKDTAADKVPKMTQEPPTSRDTLQESELSLPPATRPITQLSPAVPTVNNNAIKPTQNGEVQSGLAERVYKILKSDKEPESYQAPPPQLEQGMAKKVYKILSSDRPDSQVNGILTDALEKEHEMLKQLVQKQQAEKDDSSFEVPPRLNGTSDSFALSERDVRRQLEWSLLSSPEKGDKTGLSDFSTIRKVTSAPYNSVDTAKTLLSSQMQKVSERNFDKSVELRTPYRQAIDCYPVYGVERGDKRQEPEQRTREAWMPVPNPSRLSPEKAGEKKDPLASERFYLTHKDGSPLRAQGEGQTESPQRQRTKSDPFEISPNRRLAERGQHPRSKSEEPADVSDLSQYSVESTRYDPTNRRAASSTHRFSTGDETGRRPPDDVGLVTPAKHNPQAYYGVKRAPYKVEKRRKKDSGHESISPTESDTSGSKKLSKLRPYRPAGSRDVYYTESGDDTNESGTTLESTHAGSDDAVPPYIPSQYLGSRTDEPAKHPTGIYSTSSKDALSTIDEKSVGDEREKASVSSSKSGAVQKVNREPETQLRSQSPYTDRSREPVKRHSGSQSADMGYQTGATTKSSYDAERSREAAVLERQRDEIRLRELELKRKLDSLREKDLDQADLYPAADRQGNIDSHVLKTRDEYLRELEDRERENLLRFQYSDEKRDPLGTTVRSDPGGSLEERREPVDLSEFKRLEPEPLYPQERMRYSRSRSETDLNALSPAESQKYSSPMQPGTRFMELSSQPSPISHHESLRCREPERQVVPTGRAMTSGQLRDPSRESARGTSKETNSRYPRDGRMLESDRAAYTRERTENLQPSDLELDKDTRYPMELPRVDISQQYPMELPVVSEPRIPHGQVEREVESHAQQARRPSLEKHDRQRTISPLHVREKELERELEEMNREIAAQVKDVQGKAIAGTEEFEDNFPPSKKAQVLREVLEQEYMDNIPPNINDMWTRFKELNEQTYSESSLNSTRLDALSGLLKNPTEHSVKSFLSEKAEEKEKQQLEAEKAIRLKAERQVEIEREKRLVAEKAAYERILKRKELRQQQERRLSEEESNGSYAEILLEREKKERVKDTHKDKERQRSSKEKKTKKPDSEKAHKKSKKEKENKGEENMEVKQKHPKDRRKEGVRIVGNSRTQHSDTMDTLFSIPEDASFETSPTKSESDLKARQKRHRHVIDPLMKKLRDKIKLQRDKIDKERRKELQRVEKLKKLEMLLTAKRKGKLSDKAIDVELENVSSTTSISQTESTLMSSETTLTAGSTTMESDGSSQGSSTLIESSVDHHISPKLQYKRYPETEGLATPKKHYPETDSSATHSETSDFSNIIVERVPEKKSERKSSGKKSRSKEKKSRTDESGHKVRREKKEKKKKEVFGVELSDELLAKQLRRYERYISPERVRKQKDVGTMYPSPITVSPLTRRRLRDVYMKSEAIQTSPSVRSTSPCHTYDEVPVAPVPLMAERKHRKKSPSPDRSSIIQSRIYKSPADKSRSRSTGSRKSSRSPSAGTQTDISSPAGRGKTGSQARRKKPQSPMWKPETPPKNSMFEPESPDENKKPFTKDEDIPQGLTWFVPLKPSQPWRKPLKERQAFSVSQEPWEPKSVPQSTWKNIVHGDVLKDKSDVSNVSRDTKFDLDTTGQPIRDEESTSESEASDDDVVQSKPLAKMTLQEAFVERKQIVLSRLRERQKRLHLVAEERKMQAYLQLERDRLFHEQRRKEANPEAHPYSDNLFKPARRVISKEEMKEITQKKYKKLPEVVEHEKLKKRAEQYSLNRLKARLFNRKVQRQVLVKAEKWGR